MWRHIKRHVINATLDLYHDFPPNYLEDLGRAPRAEAAERRAMYNDVVKLRKQVGGFQCLGLR
jgi:hypothetical protein